MNQHIINFYGDVSLECALVIVIPIINCLQIIFLLNAADVDIRTNAFNISSS